MSDRAPALGQRSRTRLILARHGETDYNRGGRLQGQIDIALNERGRQQAEVLARTLSEQAPDVIVASPLSRAHDTARAVGAACGLPVTTDAALIERGFGPWEGLTPDEITERWPEEYAAFRRQEQVLGLDVESRETVGERVAGACTRLLADHPEQTVLVVAHGAAITLGITTMLGLDPEAFRGIAGLSNCHRSVLEPLHADASGRRMRLLSHNLAPDFA